MRPFANWAGARFDRSAPLFAEAGDRSDLEAGKTDWFQPVSHHLRQPASRRNLCLLLFYRYNRPRRNSRTRGAE